MPSEGFQFKGVLVAEVELFLVFYMDSHQSNSLDSFFFESYLNSIEKGRLVVTDGVKNLGFGLPVMLIKLG